MYIVYVRCECTECTRRHRRRPVCTAFPCAHIIMITTTTTVNGEKGHANAQRAFASLLAHYCVADARAALSCTTSCREGKSARASTHRHHHHRLDICAHLLHSCLSQHTRHSNRILYAHSLFLSLSGVLVLFLSLLDLKMQLSSLQLFQTRLCLDAIDVIGDY